MVELILIKLFLNKKYYNLYFKYLNIDDITDINIKRIYLILEDLHSKDKEIFTIEELALCLFSNYTFKQIEKDAYEILLNKVSEAQADDTIVEDYLKALKDRKLARVAATISLEVSEGRRPIADLLDHMSAIEEQETIIKEYSFVTDDIEELYQSQIARPGLRWRLHCLNRSLGSLRRGDFGFIFARPETGKTTFLASEVTWMAKQADGPVLWINNEEQGEKVKLRCVQASLGITLDQVKHNRELAQQRYDTYVGNKIKIYDNAIIHKHEVEDMCKQLQPKLIIFDQLDKIKGFDADRPDTMYGKIYQWARELAKVYCPVIGVCQAAGTAEGQANLTMDMVAEAKTSKQAEADWIIGIGTDEAHMVRNLNICKNKLQGDEDTVPLLRSAPSKVLLKPLIARYEDLNV